MKSENEFNYSWIAFGDIHLFHKANAVGSLPIYHFYNTWIPLFDIRIGGRH